MNKKLLSLRRSGRVKTVADAKSKIGTESCMDTASEFEKKSSKKHMFSKLLRRKRSSATPTMLQFPLLLPPPPKTLHYTANQGSLRIDLSRARALLDEHLASETRIGKRLVIGAKPPGWAPLFLGNSYEEPPGTQLRVTADHLLHLALSYCPCLQCMVDDATGEQDSIPESFDSSDFVVVEEEVPVAPTTIAEEIEKTLTAAQEGECSLGDQCVVLTCGGTASSLWQIPPRNLEKIELPSEEAIQALCSGVAIETRFELGVVRRGIATFTGQAQKLAKKWCSYFIGSMTDVLRAAEELSIEGRRKEDQKFVCEGRLYRFGVDAGAHPTISNSPSSSIAVAFRRQAMVLIRGVVAVNTGLGEFTKSDIELIIGFGEDEFGARHVARDASLGTPKHLGISELLVHVPMKPGERSEIVMK